MHTTAWNPKQVSYEDVHTFGVLEREVPGLHEKWTNLASYDSLSVSAAD